MKFLLIYPPPEPFFINKSKVFYGLLPPLGLLYLAKILQQQSDDVTLLDFSAEPYSEQLLATHLDSTDVIGMTVLSPSLNQVKQLITFIKQNHPDIPILIGGPHCTLQPRDALQQTNASICVIGDGETVITDIRTALERKKQLSEIPGIVFKTPQGMIQNREPVRIKDLDSIPFPARFLVKHLIYGREYNPTFQAGECTSIITSRGCPYQCRFCSRHALSKDHFRARSIENIIAELKEIQSQGYHHVVIADDCFPVNITHASRLFDAIQDENLRLTFSITATRVDLADETLYEKMKNAGVTHLQFGLESGNQDVLDFYHKKTTIQNIERAVHLSDQNGFFTMGSFILGAPFETRKHFQRTVAFAQSLPLDSVSFLPLRYMVGSELWQHAVNDGNINENEQLIVADKNRNLALYTKEELLRFCLWAQRCYYSRPGFYARLLKKSLKNNDMSFVRSYMAFFFSSLKNPFS